MGSCPNGHGNRRPGKFCTSCGTPLVPANPWTARPRDAQGWSSPPTDPTELSELSEHTGKPAGTSRRWVAAAAVFSVLAIVALLLVVQARDDNGDDRVPTGSGALVVVASAEPGSVLGDLHLVREGTSLAESRPFAEDSRVVPILRIPPETTSAGDEVIEAGPPPTVVPVAGGALVAWSEEAGVYVALADVGTGRRAEPVLFHAEVHAALWLNDDGTRLLVQEWSKERVSCHAGPIGEAPVLIAEAESCDFSSTGRSLAYDEVVGDRDGGDRYDVRTFDVDGSEMARFETGGRPQLNGTGTRVYVAGDGRNAVYDTRDGALVGEVPAERRVPMGWMATGEMLFAQPVEGGATVGLLGEGGERWGRPALEAAMANRVRAQPFGLQEQAVVGLRDDQGTRVELFSVGGDALRELVAAPDLDYRLIDDPENPSRTHLLAWRLDGSQVWFGALGDGELVEVGPFPTPAKRFEVDQVRLDPSTGTAYVVLIEDGQRGASALVAVNDEVTTLQVGVAELVVRAGTGAGVVVQEKEVYQDLDSTLVAYHGGRRVALSEARDFEGISVANGLVTYTAHRIVGSEFRLDVWETAVDGSTRPAILYADADLAVTGPVLHRLVSAQRFVSGTYWVP